MKLDFTCIALFALAASACGDRAPGQPAPDSQVVRPDQVTSFATLYGANCAGCHGAEGKGGAVTRASGQDGSSVEQAMRGMMIASLSA